MSLFVVPQARRAGLGARLLRDLESLHQSGANVMWAEFTSSLPQRVAFEATLRRAGWEPPFVHQVRRSAPIDTAIAGMSEWPALAEAHDRRRGIRFESWRPSADDADASDERLT